MTLKLLGNKVKIDWISFKPNTSLFIPCINRKSIERNVKAICDKKGIEVITRKVIENRVYGVRVWYIKDYSSSKSS